MLLTPAPSGVTNAAVSPAPTQEKDSSVNHSPTVPQHKKSYVGSGAFGTVRLGWLQERKKHYNRILSTEGEKTETKVIVGVCAAVAVKRMVIEKKSDEASNYRRRVLLRELQLMGRIQMYPHPNIVQCWGFIFGRNCEEQNPDVCMYTGDCINGEILTTLMKEQQKIIFDDNTKKADDVLVQRVLDGVSCVDLCLSLCRGGTLGGYVSLKAKETFLAAVASTQGATPSEEVDTRKMMSGKMSFDPFSSGSQGLTGSTVEETSSCSHSESGVQYLQISDGVGKETDSLNMPSDASHHTSIFISPRLAVCERDIVSIMYALVNALRHTHDTLQILHRDIKPSNVLICSGVGKTPEYALQSPSSIFEESSTEGSQRHETAFLNKATPLNSSTHTTEVADKSLSDSGDSVEFALFPKSPEAMNDAESCNVSVDPETDSSTESMASSSLAANKSKDDEEPSATLVVPLWSGQHRLKCSAVDSPEGVCIDYLPQAEGWRIQLADFGMATGVGQLIGSARCGTFPYMAPEVVNCSNSSSSDSNSSNNNSNSSVLEEYDRRADIYSLGVTLQWVLVNSIVEGTEVRKAAHKYKGALGAQWVDEDGTATPSQLTSETCIETKNTETATRPQFLVPNAWRCERELGEGQNIRYPPIESRSPQPNPVVDGRDDKEKEDEQKTFALPRAWRCRDEVQECRYVRSPSSSNRSDGNFHAHLLASLTGDLSDVEPRTGRKSRCRSCGKLHRHLIELLNAMTAKKPSQRPTLSTVLQSAAIIEQGIFMGTKKRPLTPSGGGGGEDRRPSMALSPSGEGKMANHFRFAEQQSKRRNCANAAPTGFRFGMATPQRERKINSCEDGTAVLLWRPPSLSFLRAPRSRTERSS